MGQDQWMWTARGSIGAVVLSFVLFWLDVSAAPWLLLAGLLGMVVSGVGGMVAKRRDRQTAEAQAEAELDRYGD